MKNPYLLLSALLLICCFYACKKSSPAKTSNSTLIVGTWVQATDHTLVYELGTNTLIKDTTISYSSGVNANNAWVYTFKSNGAFYVSTVAGQAAIPPDTLYHLHYSVSGAAFTYNHDGDTTKFHWVIKNLNNTNLQFSNTFNSKPNPEWGLDANTTYKIVDGVIFVRK